MTEFDLVIQGGLVANACSSFTTDVAIKDGKIAALGLGLTGRTTIDASGKYVVHAENNALIKWMVRRLIERGYDAPKYHAVSHPAASEVEAVRRGIALASFVEAPLLFVHISTDAGARAVAQARIDGHALRAKPGDGQFLARKPFDPTGFLPPRAAEMTPTTNFGAHLF